ncbi:protein of unknown function (plasmid) [Cupriavidus taiwanensis]|uniref:Uncharacterized protein n=1 Tax=Cupriavidus taiwanensis TaxID=164546 RepID=A0A375ILV6_9BURK|nr:hypothetical protein CBM2592_B40373 [Cupriavidus taiwanensis]SOY72235.1 hypothetical protein CBM2588_B40190 [Cupriavidus taiwanensis]SOY95800.1 hypothetical protein CBM2591_B20371 [Cupriavidus taiwanensis]SOZ75015.1 hypothetical protein CBM2617_B60289 [Cupriavidus taiwanensis]SOZ88548.1 hypothetical protein CBM2618_B50292 [Cupriavidus taiwanensis]
MKVVVCVERYIPHPKLGAGREQLTANEGHVSPLSPRRYFICKVAVTGLLLLEHIWNRAAH